MKSYTDRKHKQCMRCAVKWTAAALLIVDVGQRY